MCMWVPYFLCLCIFVVYILSIEHFAVMGNMLHMICGTIPDHRYLHVHTYVMFMVFMIPLQNQSQVVPYTVFSLTVFDVYLWYVCTMYIIIDFIMDRKS